MSSRIDILTRNAPDNERQSIAKIDELREATKAIYDSLVVLKYDPQDTIAKINVFVPTSDTTFRIMYSEINSRFIQLDNDEQSKILSNMELLLQHITERKPDENNINGKIIRIAFKIYDHLQLINSQIDCTEKTITPHLNEIEQKMREDFKKDLKSVERDHVTILGIFAAIVLAFVGTFSFSTSMLNSIVQASFIKLLIVGSLILTAFYSIMSLLINFLREINGTKQENTSLNILIIFILGVIAGLVLMNIIFYWENIRLFMLKLIL